VTSEGERDEPGRRAERAERLCIIVVPDGEEETLVEALRELGAGATRLVSKGGLRGRKSATVLSAVPADWVGRVSSMLHERFPAVSEHVPAHAFPWWSEGESPDEEIEIRLGGAVMFVVPIAGFELL